MSFLVKYVFFMPFVFVSEFPQNIRHKHNDHMKKKIVKKLKNENVCTRPHFFLMFEQV